MTPYVHDAPMLEFASVVKRFGSGSTEPRRRP